ncbi:hypothetical protein FSP39_020940 [Pinctada imbricata]|uniref:Retrovirus-related Pol polyprotein from transposon 17.6 n=1 Tax=Pinctada imbricata TaxID=66713 RepID=A0AA88XXS4_PINIB|nr:hypothetical protein FSP39_020940 [Pinctada imbricata]
MSDGVTTGMNKTEIAQQADIAQQTDFAQQAVFAQHADFMQHVDYSQDDVAPSTDDLTDNESDVDINDFKSQFFSYQITVPCEPKYDDVDSVAHCKVHVSNDNIVSGDNVKTADFCGSTGIERTCSIEPNFENVSKSNVDMNDLHVVNNVSYKCDNPRNANIFVNNVHVDTDLNDFTCSENSTVKGVDNHTNDQISNVENDSVRVEHSEVDFDQFIENFDFDKNNPHLSDNEKNLLGKVLYKSRDIFVTKENPGLGFTTLMQHHIHLKPDAISKHQRPHRISPDKREILRHHLEELLKQGIIAPVSAEENVPITSPIVIVSKRRKSSGEFEPGTREASLSSFRFCCDFRFLNSQTQQFRYSIPDLQELTESFTCRTPNFMSSIDLSSGFFQMGIAPESSKYTAFNTCFGTYKFLRLPMGLSTAPSSFQLLMDKVLNGLTFQSALCYLDDVVVASATLETHLSDLDELFDRFRKAGLKLNPFKCSFAQNEIIYLGHRVTKDGLSPPPERIEAIKNYPIPTSAKQLRSFLGLMGWFRKYIPQFASVADPLYFLLKKDVKFRWTEEHQHSFDTLRDLLVNSPILAYPQFDLQFRLGVDTSSRGIGFMLYQLQPSEHDDSNQMRVIRFGSKGLSKWQRSYGPTKLELLGMTYAVLECASYLRGSHFVVECDHQALKPLFQKKLKGAIYERWMAILQEFTFDIIYKPAKDMVVADALSRNIPEDDDQFDSPDVDDHFFQYIPEKSGHINLPDMNRLSLDFEQPEVNRIQLLRADTCIDHGYDADTDKHDNIGIKKRIRRNGYRKSYRKPTFSTIISDEDTKSQQISDRDTTNTHTSDRDTTNTHMSDRDTTNTHISDRDTTNTHMSDRDTTNHLISDKDTTNQHACDSDTSLHDNPTHTHSDVESTHEDVKDLPQSAIDILKQTDLCAEDISKLQYLDPNLKHLIDYIKDDKLPSSQKLSRRILLESSDYIMLDNVLFHSRIAKSKRTKGQSHYQIVVPESLVKTVLQIYHELPRSAHGGIIDTLDRIKEKCFFPRMKFRVNEFVKSCHECQNRKMTKIPTKAGIVSYPTPKQPFDVWQIDLQGPLPTSYRGNAYIFTATCMFSKFLFTTPVPNKDAITVSEALHKLFTTYGTCNTILSDQGSEFIAQATKEVCRMMNITQQFTPSFAHHCLGVCERTHKTLEERITPFIDQNKRNWDDLLSSVSFAINQSVNSSTGYSPFEIVFGTRPKFPLISESVSSNLTLRGISF